jgi:hypothetical protein
MSSQQTAINRAGKGLAYGHFVGWVVGMLWWICLIVFVGPSKVIFNGPGASHEGQATVWASLVLAPMAAIPWAIAGAMVGLVIALMGGWLEVVTVFVGMIGGIWGSLLLNLYGLHAFQMLFNAFVGTFVGLAVGCLVRLVITLFKALWPRKPTPFPKLNPQSSNPERAPQLTGSVQESLRCRIRPLPKRHPGQGDPQTAYRRKSTGPTA